MIIFKFDIDDIPEGDRYNYKSVEIRIPDGRDTMLDEYINYFKAFLTLLSFSTDMIDERLKEDD